MDFLEQGDEKLNADINRHWRNEAEYERYVTPLLVRLQSVEWAIVVMLHKARWHREIIRDIRAHRTARQIQRYQLKYGNPVRLRTPSDPKAPFGYEFKVADLKQPTYVLTADKQQAYKHMREMVRQVIEKIDAEKRNNSNPRQHLADRLRSSSLLLGGYEKQNNVTVTGRLFNTESYTLYWELNGALAGTLDPASLGKIEARLEHFQRCLQEFHAAESKEATVADVFRRGLLSASISPVRQLLNVPASTSNTLPAPPTNQSFAPLLLNYTLSDLTVLLTNLGLIDPITNQATPAASSGTWVGVIHALLDEKHPRLKGSKAAIWRAFSATFGAAGSERSVQNGLGTRGSDAERFRDRASEYLNKAG